MDTRFLESFVAVVDSGSLAEAARRLNLTAAAVSQRVRALELEMGAKLLSRSGRTVKPTEAGAAVLDRSRAFIRQIRDLRAIAAGENCSGELRLGAVSTALTGLLPPILLALSHSYAKLDVYIMPGTSNDLYQKLLAGDIDAALIVEPPFALPKTCEWRLFREEELLLLVPATLKSRDADVILRTEPFIRYDRNQWGGRHGDLYLRQNNIQPNERFELDALDAIAVLVDRGLGVSIVPDWAPPWPEGLSLVKISLAHSGLSRNIGLIWLRNSPRQRLINAFLAEAALVAERRKLPVQA
jgi:DNA-binding transcriptional LysR family regulator